MGALEAIDDWPVAHAAAAVCTRAGIVERHQRDAHDGDGRSDGRVFAWASVTKLVTALAALIAVEEGSVGLDQPAGPQGSTVRHLLAHASGLAPDDNQVLAKPGTRRIYSNAGFETLAAAVEQATGITFADYATEAVFAPLGMRTARFTGSPAAGVEGTIDDLAALAVELLEPTLVAPETLAEATAVAFPGLAGVLPGFGKQDPCDWGLGFELKDAKSPHWTGARNGPGTFGHFGRSGTFLWVDPAAGVATAVLTDQEFGPWAAEAWPALADAVLAEHPS